MLWLRQPHGDRRQRRILRMIGASSIECCPNLTRPTTSAFSVCHVVSVRHGGVGLGSGGSRRRPGASSRLKDHTPQTTETVARSSRAPRSCAATLRAPANCLWRGGCARTTKGVFTGKHSPAKLWPALRNRATCCAPVQNRAARWSSCTSSRRPEDVADTDQTHEFTAHRPHAGCASAS
jgi:hypothetical protein